MTTAQTSTVPVGTDGLEGWTSCCDAAVTFSGDGTLCCKGCWHEVEEILLDGDQAERLSQIVRDVITDAITPDEGVARQHALLDWCDEAGCPAFVCVACQRGEH